MKNKNGKLGTGWSVFFIIIALIAVIFIVIALLPEREVPDVDVTECPSSTDIVTVNAVNALQAGTTLSPTLKAGIDGGGVTTSITSGTTKVGIGKKLLIHGTLTDYLDTSIETVMECGGITVDMPMYYSTSDNPGIRIKNDEDNFMTDAIAGGATNQTDLTAGETLVLTPEFTGTNLESSGSGIWVIELPANSGANVTDILMPGATLLNYIPSVHTLQNAGSKAVAFRVPAVVGAEKKTYSLSIVLGSEKDLSGGVYTDWYAEQEFIDTDGTVKLGIQNSIGTAKYENTLDYDFYIDAS